MIRSSFSALTAVLIVVLTLAANGCGPSKESRRKAAQSGAEKYFELIKAGDFVDAYDRTFSTAYQRQLEADSFRIYRLSFASQTGALRAVTLVKATELPTVNGIRLVYALEGANISQPAYEILDMVEEGDEWKILSLDKRSPGSPVP